VSATKVGSLPRSILDDALAARILNGAELADMDELARILVGPMGEAAAQGVLDGFGAIDLDPDEDAFRLANDDAVDWAADRAAELVGRRRLGTEYVTHNAPPWAITESTRDGLRELVSQALADGWSGDQLRDAVVESWIFDSARAETIARTELAMAHQAGTLAAWRRSGVVEGKRWLISDLHDQDDICDINAAAGVIPLDASFPSGDDTPPAHPNCECVCVADVGDDADS
jgi:F like protein